MYNQEFKNRFLEWKKTGTRLYQSMFDKAEQYEEELGKDLAEMSTDEFRGYLKFLNVQSASSFVDRTRACETYALWAQTQGVVLAEWVHALDRLEEYVIADNFQPIFRWEDIYSELLRYYPMTEGHLIWPISVLAWLGLNTTECVGLRNEDVDLAHKQIHLPNRIVPIDDPSQWKILYLYANTTSGVRTQNRTFVVELVDCGFFLKDTKTHSSKKEDKPITTSQITSAFVKYGRKCIDAHSEPKFSFSEIESMGHYHHLYELEQTGELTKLRSVDIQRIFHVVGNTPTGPMLLAEYQLYKKKLFGDTGATLAT